MFKFRQKYLCVLIVVMMVIVGVSVVSASEYPTWKIRELKTRYESASKSKREREALCRKRICIEGKVTRIDSSFLGFPYIELYEEGEKDFFDIMLDIDRGLKATCYFESNRKDIYDRYNVGDRLLIEGRINDRDELEECKVVAKYGK